MTQQKRILFVGNTGCGKSHLLNFLGGNFKSGLSTNGEGVTTVYEERDSTVFPDTKLVDTPGLIEESEARIKQNAEQITAALKSGGSFKIVLVMGDASGRVDFNTTILLKKLHDTLTDPKIKIGFIFNKTPQHAYTESVELAPGQIDRYNQYIGSRITSHLVLKLEDGEASQKIALENSSELTEYISSLEAIELPPDSIKDDGMSFQEGELEMWRQWWDAVKEFISSGKVVGAVSTALGAAVSIIQLAVWIKNQRIIV